MLYIQGFFVSRNLQKLGKHIFISSVIFCDFRSSVQQKKRIKLFFCKFDILRFKSNREKGAIISSSSKKKTEYTAVKCKRHDKNIRFVLFLSFTEHSISRTCIWLHNRMKVCMNLTNLKCLLIKRYSDYDMLLSVYLS